MKKKENKMKKQIPEINGSTTYPFRSPYTTVDTKNISEHIRMENCAYIGQFLRHPNSFCIDVKRLIRQNLGGDTETYGFIVETNSKCQNRIVHNTTSFPCTDWKGTYSEALKELYSIVKE
jgi:hypothetical protein